METAALRGGLQKFSSRLLYQVSEKGVIRLSFFPSLNQLCRLMNITPDQLRTGHRFEISGDLFRALVKASLQNFPLDTSYYKEAHADLRDGGLNDEQLASHYRSFGYFEGREFPYLIDEDFYLSTYPDVKQAILDGVVDGVRSHFTQNGSAEGRVPSHGADESVANWKKLIAEKQRQSAEPVSRLTGEASTRTPNIEVQRSWRGRPNK